MKVLIVDDEQQARKRVERILSEQDQDLSIIMAENGLQALEMVEEHEPDVIFLDIDMPGLNGIEVAFSLPKGPRIIFVTAFDDRAVQAFELAAVDYVVKPFSSERLITAWERAKSFLPEKPKALKQLQEKLPIKVDKSYIFLPISSISALLAQGDYVEIYADEKKYLVEQTLKSFSERLPENFLQIHRSSIVNLDFIKDVQFQSQQATLTLNDYWEQQLSIGKKYQASVKALL